MSEGEAARSGYLAQEELEEELPFDDSHLTLLAEGGYGVVYASLHSDNPRIPLVVKISHITAEDIHENKDQWDIFKTERDYYEACSSRGGFSWMPAYYGSGLNFQHQGDLCPWIALEHLHCLCPLNKNGKAADQFRNLALGTLKALEGLHVEGYVHRDVKLDNFALRKDARTGAQAARGVASLSYRPQRLQNAAGSIDEVCLIDFGLLMPYKVFPPEDDEVEYLPYCGTLDYSSDRHLQEQMVGPADDLESLGYSLLELYMGESWWTWETRNRSRHKHLKKFIKENQALVLPSRHRKKRSRDPVSSNNRPRNKARGEGEKEEGEEGQPDLKARIILAPDAPASAPPAPAPHAPTSDPEATQDRHVTLSERCNSTLKRRNEVWSRLDKQGLIPGFLKEWMKYCKSLTAYDCPDYDKLRYLLQTAPVIAHIAQQLHGKAMQQSMQQAFEE